VGAVMKQRLKYRIMEMKKQLAKLLTERELQCDEVYELSTQLDKLIIEYQKKLNSVEIKN
jgi:ribosome recycling factor